MTDQYACEVSDLTPGTALQTDLTREDGSEIPVAIVRAGSGEFFAIDAMCTHAEVPLAEGEIDGYHVECWAHGSRFDVRTGWPDEVPAVTPVSTYPIRLDGERVLVNIDHPQTTAKESA